MQFVVEFPAFIARGTLGMKRTDGALARLGIRAAKPAGTLLLLAGGKPGWAIAEHSAALWVGPLGQLVQRDAPARGPISACFARLKPSIG